MKLPSFFLCCPVKPLVLKVKECRGESKEKILKKHFLYTGTSSNSVINRTVAE